MRLAFCAVFAALLILGSCSQASSFVPQHHPTRSFVVVRSTRPSRTSTSTSFFFSTIRRSATSLKWDVYVDQSKASLDKGGGATLDAFCGLAPPDLVTVHPAILFPSTVSVSSVSSTSSSSNNNNGSSSSKFKGPIVRCIAHSLENNDNNNKNNNNICTSFDVSNVDSVDKVVRVLQKHMGLYIPNLLPTVECLQWKYRGNGLLEAGQVARAIEAYNQALEALLLDRNNNTTERQQSSNSPDPQQEGTVLLMRATAHLQRAARHRETLKQIVQDLAAYKSLERATTLLMVASQQPSLAPGLLRRLLDQTAQGERQFRLTQYRHGLYQYALLQAAQDALRATELLPAYADSWKLVGEILSELWKLRESTLYLQTAIQLDTVRLEPPLTRVLQRLEQRQRLLDQARAYGWSEDSLRLALDVAR